MFKQRETIIFIVLTVGIVTLKLLQLDNTFFIYGIAQFLLYFLFGGTFIYAVFKLIKDRQPLPFIGKATPLILASLFIVGFFLLSHLINTDGGKKRVMTGGFNHDQNFIYFQLFDDNQFKLLNSGPFGGTFYRGAYTFHNDTLIIKNDRLNNLYPSLTFILKENDNRQKYFAPIDTLSAMYALYIYKDFRIKK